MEIPLTGSVKEKLESDPIPLVLVEGFMGGSWQHLWGDVHAHLNGYGEASHHGPKDRRVIFANVGPVSSLHDRACELFYSLVGGRVDYGEKHSREHGHSRYGREFSQGQFPEWSAQRPLHFLGHSMGGPTVVKLQRLLQEGLFGARGHPDMILSLTSVASPYRGTPIVYLLGESVDAAPSLRSNSIGSVFAKLVHLVSFLSPLLPSAFDLHADSRQLSFRHCSIMSLLQQLLKSDWAEGRDGTPYDVTVTAAEEREESMEGAAHSNTFYRSYAVSLVSGSKKATIDGWFASFGESAKDLFLHVSADLLRRFDYSCVHPTPRFVCDAMDKSKEPAAETINAGLSSVDQLAMRLGEEYWENDGVVPVFSQWHPLSCSSTRCHHHQRSFATAITFDNMLSASSVPEPGIWHVHHAENEDHMSLVPLWRGTDAQKSFWNDLSAWLAAIDGLERS